MTTVQRSVRDNEARTLHRDRSTGPHDAALDDDLAAARRLGVSAQRCHVADPVAPKNFDPAHARALIEEWTRRTMDELGRAGRNLDLLLNPHEAPGFPAWMAVRKDAIALHPLHRAGGGHAHLGAGLEPGDLRRRFPWGATPLDELARLNGTLDPVRRLHRYETLIETAWTWPLRAFMLGSRDARAVRSRAQLASELIGRWAGSTAQAPRLASLGCAAVGPLAALSRTLRREVASYTIVDPDPLALAAGRAVARVEAPELATQLRLGALLDIPGRGCADLRPVLGPGQQDVVEMLGFFEYLPDLFAIDLLRRAVQVTAPGGLVVAANMLRSRPEQEVFAHVIQWPRLVQRSIPKLLQLVEAAGISPERVDIRVPDEDVYAVIAITC